MVFSPDFRTFPAAQTDRSAVVDQGLRAYMLRVYNWMSSGLLLTGIVSYAIANSSLLGYFYRPVTTVYGGVRWQPTGLGVLSMLAPIGFVLVLQFGVNRLSRSAAQALFWTFCAVMGASLTNIFLVYAHESVVRVFFITAGTFAATSLYGYSTGRDLTRMGGFLMMGLFGIVIASVVNMFVASSALQFALSVIGVVVFVGLTAFDTQRIKMNYVQFGRYGNADGIAMRSVYDALSLYLNFINLFLMLMQIMGNRSSNQ